MKKIILFLILISQVSMAEDPSTLSSDVPKEQMTFMQQEPVAREPFVPQKWDFGAAVGSAWSSTASSYALIEGYLGLRLAKCGTNCFQYLDLSERIAAQRGETNYISTVSWRLQKYFEGSSWGPYFRVFGGVNHYIYTGVVRDVGLGGVAFGTFYFLHPGADLRIELGEGLGSVNWTFLTIGFVLKWRNVN